MSNRLAKTVVMIGMMGAGKTAVGTALAAMLGAPFLDSDHEIEEAARLSIPEIFDRDGEAFFRAREAEVIARLLAGTPCVLSTGGGAWLQPHNRAEIGRAAVSVWLRADQSLLWTRVRHRNTRPLLRTPDPQGTLAAMCVARDPVYALADVTVETRAGLSIDATARRVLHALDARGSAPRHPVPMAERGA